MVVWTGKNYKVRYRNLNFIFESNAETSFYIDNTSVNYDFTTNKVVKFTSPTTIGDSTITDDGITISVGNAVTVAVVGGGLSTGGGAINTASGSIDTGSGGLNMGTGIISTQGGPIDMTLGGNITGNATNVLSAFASISAAVKSFDIEHPTKGEPWRLRYGNLEGPEHGVYFRGQTTNNVIELPDYWNGLVHENSYTVNLTPIGKPCQHYVVKTENHKIYIDCACGEINTYFFIQAERKDVPKVLLEYNPTKE